jgi:hypothetical protein
MAVTATGIMVTEEDAIAVVTEDPRAGEEKWQPARRRRSAIPR